METGSQAGAPRGRDAQAAWKGSEKPRHHQPSAARPRDAAAQGGGQPLKKGSSAGRPEKQQAPEGKPHGKQGARPQAGRQPGAKPVGSSPLKQDILRLLAKSPLDKAEISEALKLEPALRTKLLGLLRDMEIAGEIARIRKDRYILPKEADLFTGVIQFHASGAAHVLNETAGEPDLYISAENTFTAMQGDRVVARVATERVPAWRPATTPRREGRVIRILTRTNETIVGTVQKSKNFFYLVADDPRFVHNLYLQPPAPPLVANVGDKVVAHLDSWPSRHVNPEGHIIEVLGPVGTPGVDMLSIIRKHNLTVDFPEAVVRDAEGVSPEVEPREAARREDLRGKFIFTIDPDDAKDFDDAIDVEATADGWKLGIHIADVSHYVRPKSEIDREAKVRGNSVYLVDRVIPMLPEALSNGICSLKPGVDRLAFSVFAEVSRQGKVHAVRFAKTVIRSAVRLTYKQAFEILSLPPRGDTLAERVHTAWEVSSLLRKKRFAAGSLDLDFPELKVWLDAKGKPVRLERVENDISHQLIEEMMLLANELVGRELKVKRQPAIYRIHEKPDADKLIEFREFASGQGVGAGDLTNRDELQKLLAGLRGQPHESAVKVALLKSLKRARYAPDPAGHYGLAKADYTHFTSPIRRYSDLVVHRALERLLEITKTGPDSQTLAAICEHISTTERTASDAERESVRLKKLEFFQIQVGERTGQTFRATIMDVRNFGMFVELPEFLLSGLVHISSLGGDFFVPDLAKGRLVGRSTKKVYRVGDQIEVSVAKVDMFKQQVDFAVA
ncbi:MAG: ribonuclease R [Verrucomicrobiae bacterium]